MQAAIEPLGTPLVREGDAALSRLDDLGVKLHVVHTALDAGDVALRQATPFHPVNAGGTSRWQETVHMLREGLAGYGWTTNDDRNSPRSIREDGRIAVTTTRGDDATGDPDRIPSTANPRGSASARAVQFNGIQTLFDFIEPQLPDMSAEKTAGVETWVLLYHRTTDGELRSELSLPVEIDNRGKIVGWKERLILPVRGFDAEVATPVSAGPVDDVEFDIIAI